MATNPIKIKSVPYPTQEALDALFNIPCDAALQSYPSVEAQIAALDAAKTDFESMLSMYLHKAYKAGKKAYKRKLIDEGIITPDATV